MYTSGVLREMCERNAFDNLKLKFTFEITKIMCNYRKKQKQ